MRSFFPFVEWIGSASAFFQRLGNGLLSLQLLNMTESGFTILLSRSLKILMETLQCPWALLILRVLIIFNIYSS